MDNQLEQNEGFHLSPHQAHLWKHRGSETHGSFALRLAGEVDEDRLRRAIDHLSITCELLRTHYPVFSGMNVPVQVIGEHSVSWHDPVALLATENEREALEKLLRQQPSGEVPLHLTLVHGASGTYLVVSLPLLSLDAHTPHLFCAQLAEHYGADSAPDEEDEGPMQYVDFAEWQNETLESEKEAVADNHWANLKLNPQPAMLPFQKKPDTFKHDTVAVVLSPSIEEKLVAWNERLPAILMATWQTLLSRLTNRVDLPIWNFAHARDFEELQESLGLVGCHLPLVPDAEQATTIEDLAEQFQSQSEEAAELQLSFFWNMLDLETRDQFGFRYLQPSEVYEQSGVAFSVAENRIYNEPFLACLTCRAGEDDLRLCIDYNGGAISNGHVRLLASRFAGLLEAALDQPQLDRQQLNLLADTEREQLVHCSNETVRNHESRQRYCIHQLFEQQADLNPDALAVYYEGDSLTYGQLNRRANQVARLLLSKGLLREERVALCLERAAEVLVAVMGVLKAGGAYLPMEPHYPIQRMRYMVENSGARLMITNAGHPSFPNPQSTGEPHQLDQLPVELIDLDDDALDAQDTDNLDRLCSPFDLAYVIYTSGSTGKPKGVLIHHHSPINLLRGLEELVFRHAPKRALRVSMNAPLSFDASMQQIIMLTKGHGLYVIPEQTRMDGHALLAFFDKHELDGLDCTPPHLALMVDAGLLSTKGAVPKVVCVAGGAIDQVMWDKLAQAPKTRFFDIYGPTEATVDCSGCIIDTPGLTPSIGRPLANYALYVLDHFGNPCPAGVPGQLAIGGDGLARGYLARPDLTAEKFIPNAFSDEQGARLYLSGDLARFGEDGRLEFLGRIDDQVKIRGFRIELGEIEASVSEHDQVHEAVVLVREDKPGDKRIVAYVQESSEPGRSLDPAELRRFLQDRLPDYMIPSAIVKVDNWPLTSNGKLDRKALPNPDDTNLRPYVAPENEMEEAIAAIFAELLEVDKVSTHDNYFELGGHSLSATRVISRLRDRFGVNLPLVEFFAHSSVVELVPLVERLQVEATVDIPALVASESIEAPPLSFSQERLWLLDHLQPGNTAYTLPVFLRLQGPLNREALVGCLTDLSERHEVLRTRFPALRAGYPVQVVDEPGPVAMEVVDLSHLPESERHETGLSLGREELETPFDLGKGPLFRVTLYVLGETDHLLLLSMHHIITDGWSTSIFMSELAQLYRAWVDDEAVELPELSITYGDYARWQRDLFDRGVMEKQLEYWREQLSGEPPVLELPLDKPRPTAFHFNGDNHFFKIEGDRMRELKKLMGEEQLTPFMVLLGAFQIILSRYSGQKDIWVGSPVANRNRAETEGLMGLFMNNLVLRTRLGGNPSGRELLRRVKKTTLAAYDHQDLPFEKLVEDLNPDRDLGHNPLFQVMFTYQNMPASDVTMPGLTWNVEPGTNQSAKFDMILDLTELPGGDPDELLGRIEFNTDILKRTSAERLETHLQTLLTSLAADADRSVGALQIMSDAEVNDMLVTWNDTRGPYEHDICLHQLFERQAEKTPGATAIIASDTRFGYGELNDHANRLAHYLRGKGVGRGDLVGICFQRRADLAIGLLGVLKTGAAYVPMDPNYPVDRMTYILDDIDAPVCLAHANILERLPETRAEQVAIDLIDLEKLPDTNLDVTVSSEDLAYIIFTSGSTGRPKGVILQHYPVVNLIQWVNTTYGVGSSDRLLFTTSLCFDLSVYDVFGSLAAGATVYVAHEDEIKNPEELARTLNERMITFWDSAPATLLQLVPFLPVAGTGNPKLRLCFLSGDWIPLSLPPAMQAAFPNIHVVGLGGATEAAIWSNFFDIGEIHPDWKSVPYGKPITNARYYVLSEQLELCPVNVPGDLYIADLCLSRGYFNQPRLTGERYLPDPYSKVPGGVLYTTGDRARFMPDGNIEFLGRLDSQVKIRGFRIELGEIESVLSEHEQVREAVAIVREDRAGDRRLVAYLLAQDPSNPPDHGELREAIASKLAEYMVPSAMVTMEQFPLTANGKLDRKALPKPEDGVRAESEATHEAPRNDREAALAEIWQDILGSENPSIRDDFFDNGGHSLLATRLILRIREHFEVELPLRALFENPTIAGLARQIQDAGASSGDKPSLVPVPRDRVLPLSYAQQRLWFLDRLYPGLASYNIPFAFRLVGQLKQSVLEAAFNEVVRRHEILRTSYKEIAGEACQIIHPYRAFTLNISNIGDADDPMAMAEEQIAREAARPFDLEKGPMLRASLLRIDERDHVLMLTIHHIAFDGWSVDLLMNELFSLYNAFGNGDGSPLPELTVQYADFAAWQRQLLDDEIPTYWREKLADPPVLNMPLDGVRPKQQVFDGARHRFALGEQLTARMQQLSSETGATLYMLLAAAFKALLYRYSGQNDIVIGGTFANRTRSDIEGMIGFFVNTLPLRTQFDGNAGFLDLVKAVRETVVDAQGHQDVPFERLVDALQPERDPSRPPFYQVVLNLMKPRLEKLQVADNLRLELLPAHPGTSKFDLTMDLLELDHNIEGDLEYNTALFSATTVARITDHFLGLLDGAVLEPQRPISRLPMLTEVEREQVLHGFNDTSENYLKSVLIHRYFEARAESSGDLTALAYGEERLSYAEMNAWANQLAHRLRAMGVGPEVLVCVCMRRSLEMVIALHAVLKAGGAYVPVDPDYPAERVRFMLRDAKARVLLTDNDPEIHELASRAGIGARLLPVDRAALTDQPAHNPEVALSLDHLAYMIYTSGSTGKPKGAANSHGAILNRLLWMQLAFQLGTDDRVLQKTPFSFDVSVWEFFWPLMVGSTLVVARPEGHKDAAYMAELIEKEAVTAMHFVPSMLQVFLEDPAVARITSLKRVFCSGEALSLELQRRFFERLPNVELHNLYGPTEAAIDVTWWACRPDSDAAVLPIGKPIANLGIIIADRWLEPLPIGVPGELFIAGVGLARGYLGRPGLCAEKFMPNPFGEEPGARLYRSGDLARWLPDGNIEFLGRIDHQVKFHGLRIELGEIENAVASHPDVSECAVLMREDQPGAQRLVAYVVAEGPQPPDSESIRAHIGTNLPDYMVPGTFMFLEAMPLSPNGKLERKALPKPEPAVIQGAFVVPETPTEQILADAWAAALGLEKVSVDVGFFALGGDSIRSVKVMSEARRRDLHFELQQLFEFQTIRALARAIDADRGLQDEAATCEPFSLISEDLRGQLPPDVEDAYPIARLQQGMLFHMAMEPELLPYHNVDSWALKGPVNRMGFSYAIDCLVKRHPIFRAGLHLDSYAEPIQIIHHRAEPVFVWDDLRGLSKDEQNRRIRAFVKAESLRPFDTRKPPLMRFALHHVGKDRFQFTITECHAISDGWSLHATINEIMNFYHQYLQEGPFSPPDPPSVTYREFIRLEQDALQSVDCRNFWQQHLAGFSRARLPRWEDGSVGDREWVVVNHHFSKEETDRFTDLAKQESVPVKTVFLAAYLKVLSAVCGTDDVVTGMLSHGRPEVEEGDDVRGLFLNTLPLRFTLREETWSQMLRRLFGVERTILPFRRFPAAEIQQMFAGDALYDAFFNFVHFHAVENAVRSGVIQVDDEEEVITVEPTHMPLYITFFLSPVDGKLSLILQSTTQQIPKAGLERLRIAFLNVLEAMTSRTDSQHAWTPLLDVERLSEGFFSGPSLPLSDLMPVHQNFEAVAERCYARPALSFQGETLSYGSLNAMANRIADLLLQKGAGPETRVAVCMDRGPLMVASLLGVLKAGAAYVPLDPNHPAARIAYILDFSQVTLALTYEPDRELVRLIEETGRSSVDMNGIDLLQYSPRNPERPFAMNQLAYAIFTSGSTGRPKGVEITHESLANFLATMADKPGMSGQDVLLAVTTISFDIAGLELFLTLLAGAHLILATSKEAADGFAIRELLDRYDVTMMQATPATWQLLLAGNWHGSSHLKVLCGGEALPPDLARALAARVGQLWNMYGPTETTIWSAVELIPRDLDEAPSIGRPIANTQIYILDSFSNMAPVGTAGELFIAGDGLARGYHAAPGQTAERFIPDPYSTKPGSRMYRCGDLASYGVDGRLAFLGRTDYQIKLRGYRIELGEIESVLGDLPYIERAVVVLREDQPGNPQLVAYLTATDEAGFHIRAVQQDAAAQLPGYMMPHQYMVMERLPLNPSGKVDRNALPKPAGVVSENYVAPKGAHQLALAEIWREILGAEKVGAQDDFFMLGGHSLLAMQLLSRIEQRFSVKLPLRALFQSPRLDQLAAVIGGELPSRALVGGMVPIREQGSQTPLFLVHPVGGSVLAYGALAAELPSDLPLYAFQAQGIEEDAIPLAEIPQMAAHYLQGLLSVRPEGPIHLGGWSIGGLIALEMAQQLRKQGREVAGVFLLDTYNLTQDQKPDETQLERMFTTDLWGLTGKDLAIDDAALEGLPTADRFTLILEQAKLAGLVPADLMPARMMAYYKVFRANLEAALAYRPNPYEGAVTLLGARDGEAVAADTWTSELLPNLEGETLPGTHYSMMSSPNVAQLAAALYRALGARRTTESP